MGFKDDPIYHLLFKHSPVLNVALPSELLEVKNALLKASKWRSRTSDV